MVGAPLTEFALATRFLQQVTEDGVMPRLLAQPWSKEGRFDREFFAPGAQGMPYHAFQAYTMLWWQSFREMAANDPPFQPFGDSLGDLRRDRMAVALNADAMNKAMNMLRGGDYGQPKSVKRLVQMLWAAASSLCADVYGAGAARS
jgi:hypothetical protein